MKIRVGERQRRNREKTYKSCESGQSMRGLAVAWIKVVVMEKERGGLEMYFEVTVNRTY